MGWGINDNDFDKNAHCYNGRKSHSLKIGEDSEPEIDDEYIICKIKSNTISTYKIEKNRNGDFIIEDSGIFDTRRLITPKEAKELLNFLFKKDLECTRFYRIFKKEWWF